jgi:hypothetical protein
MRAPKSPIKSTLDDDIISLSNKIERYCVISKRSQKSKSPAKLWFGSNPDEVNLANNMKAILNETFINTTSIRKQFDTEKLIPSEDRVLMRGKQFKAKPVPSGMFKKQPEIRCFEDILEKTRQETRMIEQTQKAIKRNEKVTNIKLNKFNKENVCHNGNELMLIEK